MGLQVADNFILRTPLKPISFLNELDSELKYLEVFQNDAVVQEAIYLASPSFFFEFNTSEVKGKKMYETLIKYINRMSTRPTPFGLFSAVSLGSFGQCGNYVIDRHISGDNLRLDMHVVSLLHDWLMKDFRVRRQLHYTLNNTVYRLHQQVRYIWYNNQETERHYTLMTLPLDFYLDKIISFFSTNSSYLSISEIISFLTSEGLSSEDSSIYIDQLITTGILINETEPRLTEKDWLTNVVDVLRKRQLETNEISRVLEELYNTFLKLRSKQVGNRIEIYNSLSKQLSRLNLKHSIANEIHLDGIRKTNQPFFNPIVQKDLLEVIDVFYRVTNPLHFQSKELNDFIKAFTERYDDQEKPLTEALDNDFGIGFPVSNKNNGTNWILNDLNISKENIKSSTYSATPWLSFIEKKYLAVIATGANELELVSEDIHPFTPPDYQMPESLSSLVSVLAPDEHELSKGNFTLLHHVTTGPGSSHLFSRFAFWDDKINHVFKEHTERESSFSEIAEIVHLPDNRIANVLCRPNHNTWELPIFTPGNHSKSISISDLFISVHNGRVILRGKNGQRLKPRLTTAHNFHHGSIAHYHFLSVLQFDSQVVEYSWSWAQLESREFLPRVRYKKTILSLAKWNFKIQSTNQLSFNSWLVEFKAFVERWKIPEKIVVLQRDHKLYLDLKFNSSFSILYKEYGKTQKLSLEEFLWTQDNCVIKDDKGKGYAHEMVISVFADKLPDLSPRQREKNDVIKRNFTPGSEWFYVKLYSNKQLADRLLSEIVAKLTSRWERRGYIKKWFFIRFTDSGPHIRLRLLINGDVISKILKDINSSIKNNEWGPGIYNISVDTYSRELERYGSKAIALTESLFCLESNLIIDTLKYLKDDVSEFWKQVIAIHYVEQLVSSTNFNSDERLDFYNSSREGFFDEFNVDRHQFNKEASRKYRSIISPLKEGKFHSDGNVHRKIERIVGKHFLTASELLTQIRRKNKIINDVDLKNVLRSYIHMFINRFFIQDQRMIELLTYDFLAQYVKMKKKNPSFISNNRH